MLIKTENGWVRPAAVHAIPSLPTQHPSGFKDGSYSEWKLLGYPNIDTYLDAWAASLHNNFVKVPRYNKG